MLDVRYPPEFSAVDLVTSTQLSNESSFTFYCTPSAANPAPSFSFMRNGSTYTEPAGNINGSVLTISSVVRADTGNYSCTATNTAGSTTLYYNLLVVAPPTPPLNLMVSGEMAFSAMVTWTPPTDGGIYHPSWTSPSPSSSPIVQYTVAYSNSSGSWSIDNLNTPLVALTNLQHSTDYTVTVAASNAHGQSTAVQGTFRTLDSKPILHALELNVLSLSSFTVNVTFLTGGGQSVTLMSVQLNGGNSTTYIQQIWDGKMVEVSLLVRSQNFAPDTNYSVSVSATSNAGTSDPIIGVLHVPNPPNITVPPTELSPSSHGSPCCSAVKLNLAEPGGVSSVGVSLSTGGGPFKIVDSGDASLDGDVLYVSGLQAGAVYVAKITVSNAIGSSSTLKALVPLLGTPSAPTMVIVAAGTYTSVSVVMATSHPGTFTGRIDNMLLFQVQILKNGRFVRTELVMATAFSLNVTTATYNGILDPGSYSVRVTAVNEYGQSSAVMSKEFTLEDSSQVTTIVLAVIVVVLSLALLAVSVYSVVVTAKRKHGSSWKPPQQKVKSEPVYAGMEMESRSVNSELKMESNPAYSTTEGVKKANSKANKSISSAGGEVEYEAMEVTK